MARRPLNVTGDGAKYVAAGRKQQAANAGRAAVSQHNAGMANMFANSQGNPSSGDHAPAPPSSTPRNLSSQQFDSSHGFMNPGGAMGSNYGAVKRTTPMHPGGAGMGGPKFVVPSSRPASYHPEFKGRRTGNTSGSGSSSFSSHFDYADMNRRGAISNPNPPLAHSAWDEDAFPGVLGPTPSAPRGNANTSVSKALGGTAKRSRPVKAASTGGNTAGGNAAGKKAGKGRRMNLKRMLPHASKHAGKLAGHLKAATGVK